MPTDPTRDDLAFLRRVSEEGRYAPLVGGRYLVMWGTLIVIAYLFQYGILSGRLGWPPWSLLVVWAVVGVVAAGFMIRFSRARGTKPGEGSVGQRVEREIWMAVGIGIGAYTSGTFVATSLGLGPVVLFDVIIAVALAGYGAAFLVVSAIAAQGWMRVPAALSFTGAGVIPFVAGQPVTYLVGAGFVFTVVFVPGIVLLRAEPPAMPREGE